MNMVKELEKVSIKTVILITHIKPQQMDQIQEVLSSAFGPKFDGQSFFQYDPNLEKQGAGKNFMACV